MHYQTPSGMVRSPVNTTRLAMIVGIGGAGKSTVVQPFQNRAHIIYVDHIQGAAGHRLSPFSKPLSVWEWKNWRNLLEFSDAATAIRLELQDQFYDNLNDGRPIIAEGAILALEPWKDAFVAALNQLNITLAEERIFWLDPKPEVLLRNIHARGRSHERELDLKRVSEMRSWFGEKCSHLFSNRFEDGDDLSNQLQVFLEESSGSRT